MAWKKHYFSLFTVVLLVGFAVAVAGLGTSGQGGAVASPVDNTTESPEQVIDETQEESSTDLEALESIEEKEQLLLLLDGDELDDTVSVSGVEDEEDVRSLQVRTETIQEPVVDELEELDGVTVDRQFWITNSLLVTVDPAEVDVDEIAAVEGIRAFGKNVELTRSKPVGRFPGGKTGDTPGQIAEESTAFEDGADKTSADLQFGYPTPIPSDEDVNGEHSYALETINAPEFWNEYDDTGEDATVAVIDDGLNTSHPDIEVDEGGTSALGIVNDTEERVEEMEGNHGAHVAGIATGDADTAGDVPAYGVAPDANLQKIDVFYGPYDAEAADILDAMQWAVDDDGKDPADVISISPGFTTVRDSSAVRLAMDEAIRNAQDEGAVVVGAVGNDGFGEDGGPTSSPGSEFIGLSVGAVDADEEVPEFSSGAIQSERTVEIEDADDPAYGDTLPEEYPRQWVDPDVTAPGVGIVSAGYGTYDDDDAEYAVMSGSSMAAPHVAGAVALLQSEFQDRDAHTIKNALVETAEKPAGAEYDDLGGERDIRYGTGIIDVTAAAEALGDGTTIVDGTVTDDEGEPLVGATVESQNGAITSTDGDGEYTLEVTNSDEVTVEKFGFVSETESVESTVDFDLTSEVDADLVDDQEMYSEFDGEFSATFDVRHLENYTVEVEDEGDLDATFDASIESPDIDTEDITLGEEFNVSDPPVDTTVTVTIDITDDNLGEGDGVELVHTFDGQGDEITLESGPTDLTETVQEGAFEIKDFEADAYVLNRTDRFVTAEVTIENVGEEEYTEEIDYLASYDWEDPNSGIIRWKQPTLAPGEEREFRLVTEHPVNNVYDGGEIVEHGFVTEIDERDDFSGAPVYPVSGDPAWNEDAHQTLYILESEDAHFEITDVDAPRSAEPGEEIDVTATIENFGNETATQDVEYTLSNETDELHTDAETVEDLDELAGSNSEEVTFDGIELPDGDGVGLLEHELSTENDSVTIELNVDAPQVTVVAYDHDNRDYLTPATEMVESQLDLEASVEGVEVDNPVTDNLNTSSAVYNETDVFVFHSFSATDAYGEFGDETVADLITGVEDDPTKSAVYLDLSRAEGSNQGHDTHVDGVTSRSATLEDPGEMRTEWFEPESYDDEEEDAEVNFTVNEADHSLFDTVAEGEENITLYGKKEAGGLGFPVTAVGFQSQSGEALANVSLEVEECVEEEEVLGGCEEFEEKTLLDVPAVTVDDENNSVLVASIATTEEGMDLEPEDYPEEAQNLTANAVEYAYNQTEEPEDLDDADFEVIITDTPDTVYPGDRLTVEYNVENSGEAEATQEITLSTNATETLESDTETVTLGGGETHSGTLNESLPSDLDSDVAVEVASEDSNDTTSISLGEPAFFNVSVTDAPDTVEPGDDATVEYAVENTGDREDTQEIQFEVNGTVESTEEIELDGGATFSDEFTHGTDEDDTGELTLAVQSDDDSDSRSITVEVEAAEVVVKEFEIDDQLNNESFIVDARIVEEDNVTTDNLAVGLEITSGGTDYTQEIEPETELKDNQTTVEFGIDDGTPEVGPLEEGPYGATLTADADNAGEVTNTTGFDVEVANSSLEVGLEVGDRADEPFEVEVEAGETAGAETRGLKVGLIVEDGDGNEEYNQTVEAAETEDLDEIQNESVFVTFGNDANTPDVNLEADEDSYKATATADADNADEAVDTDEFEVNKSEAEVDVEEFEIQDKLDDEGFTVDVTANETSDNITSNLRVGLTVEDPDEERVYDQEIEAETELQGNETTVTFGEDGPTPEVGPLDATDEDYTATASVRADNADEDEMVDGFGVDVAVFFSATIDDVEDEVVEGDQVTVDYTVQNTGEAEGEQTVLFEVNGAHEGEEEQVNLDGGDTFNGDFEYETEGGDVPEIDITVLSEDDSDTETVTVLEPAFFDVTILDIEDEVVEGDEVTVNYLVDNTGDATDSQEVRFEVNQTEETVEENVEIDGGENFTDEFAYETDGGDLPLIEVVVASEDTEASSELTVLEEAFFDVEIIDTEAPVREGETVDVELSVENLGEAEEVQDIELEDFDGNVVESTPETLEGGESKPLSLGWDTSVGDNGTGDITATTEDTTDSATVTVATQVDECRTIDTPGIYWLTGDITPAEGEVPDAGCILIDSSGVDILGDGNELSGPGQGVGVNGSGNSALEDVSVEGLTVTGFETGILFEGIEDSEIRDTQVTGNEEDVLVRSANDNTVSDTGGQVIVEDGTNQITDRNVGVQAGAETVIDAMVTDATVGTTDAEDISTAVDAAGDNEAVLGAFDATPTSQNAEVDVTVELDVSGVQESVEDADIRVLEDGELQDGPDADFDEDEMKLEAEIDEFSTFVPSVTTPTPAPTPTPQPGGGDGGSGLSPADFDASVQVTPDESELNLGDSVEIELGVENVGGEKGDTTVKLVRDGETVSDRFVSLPGYMDETVQFYETVDAGGYEVLVDGEVVVEFEVEDDGEVVDETGADIAEEEHDEMEEDDGVEEDDMGEPEDDEHEEGLPGFTVFAAVVAVLSVLYLKRDG